jgi:hypothetical protein
MSDTSTRRALTALNDRDGTTSGIETGAATGSSRHGSGVVDRFELGQTRDPAELIPGDPEQLRHAADRLRTHSRAHHDLAIRLRAAAPTDEDWTGPAAQAFGHHLTQRIARHHAASDTTEILARALTLLTEGLTWARGQARAAIELYDSAAKNAAPTSSPTNPDPSARRADDLPQPMSIPSGPSPHNSPPRAPRQPPCSRGPSAPRPMNSWPELDPNWSASATASSPTSPKPPTTCPTLTAYSATQNPLHHHSLGRPGHRDRRPRRVEPRGPGGLVYTAWHAGVAALGRPSGIDARTPC